jgi:hypothetical protein
MGKVSHTNKNIRQSIIQHSTFHKFSCSIQLLNISFLLIFLHLTFGKQTFTFFVKEASARPRIKKNIEHRIIFISQCIRITIVYTCDGVGK